jgi:hypothetical protein
MTTLAAQIVFHPAVSQSLRFGGTTTGRDKVQWQLSDTLRFQAFTHRKGLQNHPIFVPFPRLVF